MSWATVIEDNVVTDDNNLVGDEQSGSEEAILHGLRSAYNAAMQTIGLHSVCSSGWVQALTDLETISNSCSSYVETIPSARIQLQEMSYLAKRNRVECLAKDPSNDINMCYQLILDTISVMMELEKEDLSLILLAARYAKKLNDLWTYKQLILSHQDNLPYMYKDLIMRDFERTISQGSGYNDSEPSVAILHSESSGMEVEKLGHDSLFLGSALRAGAQDQFVSFISQRIVLGQDCSDENVLQAFSRDWLAPVGESASEQSRSECVHQETGSVEAAAAAAGHGEVQAMVMDTEDDIGIVASDSVVEITRSKDSVQEALSVGNADADTPPEAAEAAGKGSRRSGRAAKKTDPTAWEDRALQTALEASKAMSRVPSQSQLSRGTSASDEIANISEIKKLLEKSSGLSNWSSLLHDDSEGLRALYYTFALPTSILETPTLRAATQEGAASQVTQHVSPTVQTSEGALSEDEPQPIFTYGAVTALFEAFLRVVRSHGALPDLMHLHVAFIQTVASVTCNSACSSRKLCAELDCAVLHSWRALTTTNQISTDSLLARLNEKEELLLLEAALSVVQRDHHHGSGLHGLAFEILQFLLPRTLSAETSSVPFWLRFAEENHQVRALWAAVLASRFFGVDALGSLAGSDATSVDLLSAMISKFNANAAAPQRIWLPHVSDKQHQLISAQSCRDLQDVIRYEAEVRDLLGSLTPSKPWVQGVLGQIRLGERLQSLLGFRQQQQNKENDASVPQSIPVLLLEACRTLKDFPLWVEVAEAVLGAVIAAAFDTDGLLSGSWMAELLTSLFSNLPSTSQAVEPSFVESLFTSICILLYVNGTQLDATAESQAIVLSCIRLNEEIVRMAGGAAAVRSAFPRTLMHVLIAQSQRVVDSPPSITALAADSALPVLCALWSQFIKVINADNTTFLANLSESAWGSLTRLVVEMWEALDSALDKEFRTLLLSVLLNLLTNVPSLSMSCRGEVLVHCHFEILDNALHLQEVVSHASRRKRKREQHSAVSAAAPPRVTPVTQLLCAALEEIVFDDAFETDLAQRVQREMIFVLGQVYFYTYGLPMVPLDGGGASDDEDSVENEVSSGARLDGQDAALLSKLFAFSKVCIKGGWVNKAEIRASLLMLSQADAFKAASSRPGAVAISEHIFCTDANLAQDDANDSLLHALQSVDPSVDESNRDSVELVGTELFSTLLQLGLPPAEVDDGESEQDAEGLTTSLAQCDLGLFLQDRNQGATVELCLQDLAFNPLRFASWHLLLVQFMETFNAVMDEMQKLFLPHALPAACYSFVLLEYLALLRPVAASDRSQICLWRPNALVPEVAATKLLDSAVGAVQTACDGADLVACFETTLAAETFFNLHRTAESTDYENHLRKVCHLVSIRNACFHVYQKVSHFMEAAVATGRIEMSDEQERAMWHLQAEIGVMTLSNAAKCLPKAAEQRIGFQKASLLLLQHDNYFDDDLYALSCSAKLQWQLAKHSAQGNEAGNACRLTALATCHRAVQVLKGENAKVYSKPVRLSVLYQVSSICLKAALLLVQALVEGNASSTETLAREVTAIEECMTALLPTKVIVAVSAPASVSSTSESGSGVPTPEQDQEGMEVSAEAEQAPAVLPSPEARVWTVLQMSFAGLKECRRVDAFDFKSVYRITRGISELSKLLQHTGGAGICVPPTSLLELLGVRELSQSAALEELARVFDRKRSQIVAMWCVENAVSPWEKILVRISQFDTLRKKFIDEYLRLAVVCHHLEVVLDVLAFALSAVKHATAVVLHTLQAGVASFRSIVLAVLSGSDQASMDTQDQGVATRAASGEPEPSNRRESLCREATRWLHVMFELHHQLRPIASDRTLAHLEDIVLALYPHSSVFVAPLPVTAAAAPTVSGLVVDGSALPPAVVTAMDVIGGDGEAVQAGESTHLPVPETALTATEVLALCADKWGRPKQPRSDLGKRAKGYFAARSAAASAALAVAPATAEPAVDGGAVSNLAIPAEPELSAVGEEVALASVAGGVGYQESG